MPKTSGPVLKPKPKGKRIVLRHGGDTGRICPDEMEYCYQCGYVDKREAFLKENKCPNSKCPSPHLWDD